MTDSGRVVAIIQARMGSARLPGKVLADLAGRPMIDHVVERARLIKGVHEVVVAIPDLDDDDQLYQHLSERRIRVVRGPAEDVLSRFVVAAEAAGADTVVRITADCPVLSPTVSGRTLELFRSTSGADYASNTLQRTFPRGFDTEVLSAAVLRQASADATDPSEREHVTAHVWRRPGQYRLVGLQDATDRSNWRLTVDTPEDQAVIRALFAALEMTSIPDYPEIVDAIERDPLLLSGNQVVAQVDPFR